MMALLIGCLVTTTLTLTVGPRGNVCDVRTWNAKGDNTTDDTKAIQTVRSAHARTHARAHTSCHIELWAHTIEIRVETSL